MNKETQFWGKIPVPNPIFTSSNSPSESNVSPIIIQEQNVLNKEKNGNTNLGLPTIDSSQTGGEILPKKIDNPNTELQVYRRQNNHQNSKAPYVLPAPAQSQSSSPSPSIPDPSSKPETQKNLSPIVFPDIDSLDLDIPIALRKGVRTFTKHPIARYLSYNRLSPTHRAFTSKTSCLFIPKTIQEAMNHSDWKLAVLEEMRALKKKMEPGRLLICQKKRNLWDANGCSLLSAKQIGVLEKYKARLVAKGFTQTYGIDYQETFSSIAEVNSIRVLISLAANFDWPLHQFDIKKCLSKWRVRGRGVQGATTWV